MGYNRNMKKGVDHRKILGTEGEKSAEKFLKKNGFKIVEKNYRNRFGEIDIIAMEEDCLVFVEVKTKSNVEFAEPETWVDFRKQNQLIKMASYYLSEKDINNTECRFDVVGVTIKANNKKEIVHLRSAFSAQ